jgi:hypothetical protein
MREITSRLRWGHFDRGTALLVVPIIAVSSVALVLWFRWATPDLSNITAMAPKQVNVPLALSAAIVFSAANALWEELLMKWIMWDALERLFGVQWSVIILQAFFFGLLHYHGFPRGVMGGGHGGRLWLSVGHRTRAGRRYAGVGGDTFLCRHGDLSVGNLNAGHLSSALGDIARRLGPSRAPGLARESAADAMVEVAAGRVWLL